MPQTPATLQPGDEVVTEPPAQKIINKKASFSGLDKITGRIINFDEDIGETVQFGALRVKTDACYTRPATEAANTDAFVEVDEITLQGEVKRIFSGWMFAASPGLHGVEHPIYDIWLTDCKGPDTTVVTAQPDPPKPAAAPPPAQKRAAPKQAPRPPPPPQFQQQPQQPPPPPPPQQGGLFGIFRQIGRFSVKAGAFKRVGRAIDDNLPRSGLDRDCRCSILLSPDALAISTAATGVASVPYSRAAVLAALLPRRWQGAVRYAFEHAAHRHGR